MQIIQDQAFDQERALYGSRELTVKNCRFDGPADGESAFKECSDIRVADSYFNLRYPFWHVDGLMLEGSELVEFGFYIDGELQEGSSVTFTEGANVTFGVMQMTALIPEPTTTTLSLLALSALCLRRRRQK